MPRKHAHVLIFTLLLLVGGARPCFGQSPPAAEAELARKLAAAASEEERAALVAGAGELLNAKLVDALKAEGSNFGRRGEALRAIPLFRLALGVAERLGDQSAVNKLTYNIGFAQRMLGDYQAAIGNFERSLALSLALDDKVMVVNNYNSLGAAYNLLGDRARALRHYLQSVELAEQIKRPDLAANARANTAIVYHQQGDYAQAADFYQKNLKVFEGMGDRDGVASVLNNYGGVLMEAGRYDEALENYRRTLSMRREAKDRGGEVSALLNLGVVYRLRGEYEPALEHLSQALALARELGDREGVAEALGDIAKCHLGKGDYLKALEAAGEGAAVSKQTGALDHVWNALTTAGSAARGLGRFDEARKDFEEAIAVLEALRTRVAGDEQQRQRYFEDKLKPYHEMLLLLASQKRAEEALAYAERAKARVLLDVLRSGRRDISKAMTPQERERERAFDAESRALNLQLNAAGAAPRPDPQRLAELSGRLQQARLERQSFQTAMYAAHPGLKVQRGEAPPFDPAADAPALVGEGEALLEFAVTEGQTYLFVLTRERGRAKPSLGVYPLDVKRKDLARGAEQFRELLEKRSYEFRRPARALYDLLLAPAAGQLKGKTSLVIVPDASLWGLPFQALLDAQNRYLIEEHAVSYAPSLGVLREMSRGGRAAPAARGGATLLAVGYAGAEGAEGAGSTLLGADGGAPLPEAARQARELGRLYKSGESKVYVGEQASEDRVKREVGQYRVVQFAAHGILDDANPMYSRVLLSPAADRSEDGMLEAWEMMNLDLHADMVVLSACDTARGRYGAGEGVIGMSWALFIAGSPTTVVSQWKVESASTTELMLDFHRNLLAAGPAARTRVSKAEALRRTALRLLGGAREYRHPFYWAGFVIVGDAR